MKIVANIISLLILASYLRIKAAALPPHFVSQPSPGQHFYDYVPIYLDCEAHGDSPVKYYWEKDGKPFDYHQYKHIHELTHGTLVFSDLYDFDVGKYQCFAKNELGTAMSNEIDINTPYLNSFNKTESPLSLSGNEGQPFNLTCKLPYGRPEPEAFWFKQHGDDAFSDHDITSNSRITYDPKGTLWFSYLKLEDATTDFTYSCGAKSFYTVERGNRFRVKVNKLNLNTFAPSLQYISKKNEVAQREGTIKLYCIFSGNPVPTVKWLKDGLTVENTDRIEQVNFDKTLVIKKVDLTDKGVYTCEVSNGIGRTIIYAINLDVVASPYFIEEPQSANKDDGESVELRCLADGNPKPYITQWFHNGKLIDDDSNTKWLITQNSIIINDLTQTDAGNYGCKVINPLGYAYSETYVNVRSLPPTLIEILNTKSAYSFTNVTLECAVKGIPRPTITWYHNDHEISNERLSVLKNDSLHIQDVELVDSGIYTCRAENRYGVTTGKYNLIVKKHTAIIRRPKDLLVKSSSTAIFVCDAASVDNIDVQVIWLRHGEMIDFDKEARFLRLPDNTLAIVDVGDQDAGAYTCIAKTDIDEDSASVTLRIQNSS